MEPWPFACSSARGMMMSMTDTVAQTESVAGALGEDPVDSVPGGDFVDPEPPADGGPDDGGVELPEHPVQQPRTVLAELQRAGAVAGRGPPSTPARTHEVPGHLRQQPRRVLHGPRRRLEAALRHGPDPHRFERRACPRARCWPASPTAPASCPCATPEVLQRRRSSRAGRRAGIRLVNWEALDESARAADLGEYFHARSSRSSPRWPSTRPTRSPTSPGSRSTWPCS